MSVSFNDQLKRFILDNSIVGSVAGIALGYATRDLTLSMISDIFVPFVQMGLKKLHVPWIDSLLPSSGFSGLNVTHFIQLLLNWILILIISFFFVKYTFEYLLGISNNKSDEHVAKDGDKNGKNGNANGNNGNVNANVNANVNGNVNANANADGNVNANADGFSIRGGNLDKVYSG